jgi:hypothetical protein
MEGVPHVAATAQLPGLAVSTQPRVQDAEGPPRRHQPVQPAPDPELPAHDPAQRGRRHRVLPRRPVTKRRREKIKSPPLHGVGCFVGKILFISPANLFYYSSFQ